MSLTADDFGTAFGMVRGMTGMLRTFLTRINVAFYNITAMITLK